ncbi:MAG: glycosyltransferase [Chloroflexota bacterium]
MPVLKRRWQTLVLPILSTPLISPGKAPLLLRPSWQRSRGLPLVVTPFAHLGVKSRDRVARNSTMDHQLDILRRADGVLVLTDVERSGLADYRISAEKITVLGGGGVDPAPVDLTGGGGNDASRVAGDICPLCGPGQW